jgi:hypothetical protein
MCDGDHTGLIIITSILASLCTVIIIIAYHRIRWHILERRSWHRLEKMIRDGECSRDALGEDVVDGI